MTRIGLLFFGLILVAAAVVQLVPRPQPIGVAHSRLSLLPGSGTDWQVRTRPLGPTEAGSAAAAAVLQFDDVVNRDYVSSAGVFSVYAAYWRAGKIPVQLVASHTPDRCWTSVGWDCVAIAHKVNVQAQGEVLRGGEAREFRSGASGTQHVVYWHLVGSALYHYGDRLNTVPSFWRWWRDAGRQLFQSPPEQYFIRLSSELPIERLKEHPAFNEVVAALAQLGLGDGSR